MRLSRTVWVCRATLRLLNRDIGLSTSDALVMAAAVAECAEGAASSPEAAVDSAFELHEDNPSFVNLRSRLAHILRRPALVRCPVGDGDGRRTPAS